LQSVKLQILNPLSISLSLQPAASSEPLIKHNAEIQQVETGLNQQQSAYRENGASLFMQLICNANKATA
jgi:hypothetical protein